MSTDNSPQLDPGGSAAGMANVRQKQPPKPRSPRERAIVWSTIGILLVVLGIEACAWFAFQSAHGKILDALRKAEEQDDYRVTKSIVSRIFQGKEPTSSETIRAAVGQGRLDVYVWKGLLRNRTLNLHYSIQGTTEEPEVMEVSTSLPEH
jgi:hypothetical protein